MDKNFLELVYAVIERAIIDYKTKTTPHMARAKCREQIKNEAKEWLLSKECKSLCEIISFDYGLIEKFLKSKRVG